MATRVAKSLETLRRQLNELYPDRSKASDGGVGDKAHQKRKSDHNPNKAGVVQARDFTYDTNTLDGEGIDCKRLAEVLFKHKDPRIKYLIFNRKITIPGLTGWKPYTGENAHLKHIHISVNNEAKLYDDPKEWDLTGLKKESAVVSQEPATSFTNTESASNTSDDSITEQSPTVAEPSTKEVSVTGETISIKTSESSPTEKEIVAVEKPEPKKFGEKLRNRIASLTGGNVGMDFLTEKMQQIQALGMSAEFWIRVSYFAIAGSVVYLIFFLYKHYSESKRDLEITNELIRTNTTPDNIVMLVSKEEIDKYEQQGIKVIRR